MTTFHYRQRSAHARRGFVRFVCDADGVGTNGQMRAVLLDHANREDEQRPLTIERINPGPGELFKLVGFSTWKRKARVRWLPEPGPPPHSR